MSEAKALNELLALIRADDYAISFQSLGQYRTALINEVKRQIRGLEREVVTGSDEPKLHYYAFSFSSHGKIASSYVGWPDFPVTIAKIEEARAGLNLGASVLVSCCYLGHMTKSEMVGVSCDG